MLSTITDSLFNTLGLPKGSPLNRDLDGGPLSPLLLIGDEQKWQPLIDSTGLKIAGPEDNIGSLVIDFTRLEEAKDLMSLQGLISPLIGRMKKNASIVIVGLAEEACPTAEKAAVFEGLVGLTKSLAKEVGLKAIRVNLVRLIAKSIEWAFPVTDFLLSPGAAYISGQVFNIDNPAESKLSLTGKTAIVTGASRGIGAAIAKRLHQQGAKIIGVDIPAMEEALADTLEPLNGIPLLLDITSETAEKRLIDFLSLHKPIDILVHNAGITRDKTIKKMRDHEWQQVISVNLTAMIKINQLMIEERFLADDAHIIAMSSMNGIAGQVGQTNYSTSKAGIIGYTKKAISTLPKSMRFNAVAPGFIKTQMTDQIPFMTREFGQRLNAMGQPGLPEDVANTIGFLASAQSRGINGQTIRVCGLSLPGA